MKRKINNEYDNLVNGGKISAFYAFSLIFAGLYLFGHINQLQETIIRPGTGYLNITNLVLCALGICESVFPLFIALGKDKWLKWDLYIISALYAFGNLWFIRWIYVVITSGELSFDFAAYQLQWFNMFNHTIWASRNAESLLLNYLNAVFWFNIARNIDRDKYKTCTHMILMMVNSFALPVIFFAATRFKLIPEWWIQKSITLLTSYICVFIMMWLSAKKRTFWTRYICTLKTQEIKK